ncbi:MAG: hypothetical protein LBP22_14815 [Deltaproteobacteria bacterium]|jgi:hypothetical protein|nr:hypothetical protein [Deltaproteobacteria bacterium]
MKTADDSPAALKSAQAGLPRFRDRNCGGASQNPIFIIFSCGFEGPEYRGLRLCEKRAGLFLDSQDLVRLSEQSAEEAD